MIFFLTLILVCLLPVKTDNAVLTCSNGKIGMFRDISCNCGFFGVKRIEFHKEWPTLGTRQGPGVFMQFQVYNELCALNMAAGFRRCVWSEGSVPLFTLPPHQLTNSHSPLYLLTPFWRHRRCFSSKLLSNNWEARKKPSGGNRRRVTDIPWGIYFSDKDSCTQMLAQKQQETVALFWFGDFSRFRYAILLYACTYVCHCRHYIQVQWKLFRCYAIMWTWGWGTIVEPTLTHLWSTPMIPVTVVSRKPLVGSVLGKMDLWSYPIGSYVHLDMPRCYQWLPLDA